MFDSYPDDGPLQGSQFQFDDRLIRMAFIRKVYGILMCQLIVTLGFISLFLYNEPIQKWTAENPSVFLVAFAITFIVVIVLACCKDVSRKSPHNFIFLGIFTFAEGFLLGAISAQHKADTVLIAVGICAVVCFALTCFAFQTKFDFTGMGSILFVMLVVLLCSGLLAVFIPSKTVELVYACFGALIFSAYLVFDTQLMMGGKHKYSVSPEEYIFAALNLYLDIINLFLFILRILSAARE